MRTSSIISVVCLAFWLQFYSAAGMAQEAGGGGNEQEPIPAYLRPCMEWAPSPPGVVGNASVVIKDQGTSCSIMIIFDKQSDLEKYRNARIREKLSPDSIKYTAPDGSVREIPLELRRKTIW